MYKQLTLSFLAFFCLSQIAGAQDSIPFNQQKFSEFSFWVGEWDVYKYGTDTIVGKSSIKSIVDGKGLSEHYSSLAYPYHGTSLNKYNPVNGRWEQFWVDNSGLSLFIHGGIEEGKMILGNEVVRSGKKILNRITWTPMENNEVCQCWDQSYDEGKNWKNVFDGHYKPN